MAFVTRRRSHFLTFLTPLGGADLLRYGGLLCSGRPAGLLRTPGRFTPEHASMKEEVTLNRKEQARSNESNRRKEINGRQSSHAVRTYSESCLENLDGQ
jgi:hypothetical protein